MRSGRRASVLFGCAAFVAALPAGAAETAAVGGEPVRIDVTEATSVIQNVDNRNTRPGDYSTRIDDNWGFWYNRLNTQASWKNFQAGLRLDSAWFYTAPNPTDTSLALLAERRAGNPGAPYTADDARFFKLQIDTTSGELTTRYTSWLYPSKYYVGYTNRYVEATVGDFYASFGRGLVLSVRKMDELSSDTTIRGGRVTGHIRAGDFRLKMTALGGEFNPLRIDEASGRFLGVTRGELDGFTSITEGGMPRAIRDPIYGALLPTYSPDRVAAAEIEGGTRDVQVGLHGSLVDRTFTNGEALNPGAVRSAKTVRMESVSINAPDLGGHGAAYVEAAFQDMSYPGGTHGDLPDNGFAIYGSATANYAPVTLTAEVKHYRSFYPLLGNVDTARATEFAVVQYNTPPTTEGVWVDTEFEGFNTCVSGGRLKADVEVAPRTVVFAWVGRYNTWAESIANEKCRTARANLNQVWDFASGLELVSRDRKSRVSATFGTRFDDTEGLIADPSGGETHMFYRELYGRYEVTEWLGGPFSLKLQGWDRRRHQTLGGVVGPYTMLQQLIALDYAAKLIVGAGFEYTGDPTFPPTYFNGTLGYNLSSSSNITLFAGQRRGGLKCVSGVCRIYPSFEGVRLDATFRF